MIVRCNCLRRAKWLKNITHQWTMSIQTFISMHSHKINWPGWWVTRVWWANKRYFHHWWWSYIPAAEGETGGGKEVVVLEGPSGVPCELRRTSKPSCTSVQCSYSCCYYRHALSSQPHASKGSLWWQWQIMTHHIYRIWSAKSNKKAFVLCNFLLYLDHTACTIIVIFYLFSMKYTENVYILSNFVKSMHSGICYLRCI